MSMRRVVSAAAVVMVTVMATGCDSVRGLFTAKSTVAAEVGNQALSSERLAKILGAARGIQLNRESADLVAGLWTNYTLFAQAVAEKKPVADSATAAQALWPQLFELRANRWHDSVAARLSPPNPNLADSVYNAGTLRVLQHILFVAQQGAPDSVVKKARAQAEATLKQLKGGADFGELATKLSKDPGSAADKGYLNPSPKGAFVPAFDSAGWALAPGQTSGIVQTNFGFHIIRRPPLEEVKDRLTRVSSRDVLRAKDSAYLDALSKSKQLTVAKNATALMKAALAAPEKSKGSGSAITTFTGGKLDVSEFLRWISTVPPQFSQQLKAADDVQLTQFATMLSQNILFVKQADSAKVTVPAEEWQKLYGAYKGQVDSLITEMGLNTGVAGDSTASARDRRDAALKKVDDYFDKLITNQIRLRPLPVALSAVLRERTTNRMNDTGLNKALELARAEQAKTGGAPGAQAPGMRPAQGPPPVPGEAPPAAPAPAPTDTTRR
jgi:hypothetical protein